MLQIKTVLNMTKFLLFLLLLSGFNVVFAQDLYVKTFGDSLDTPTIFIHGGPGYNCATFEATTAEKLASKGFYLVVYDRRGEGRSVDSNAQFTFEESIQDLNYISDSLNLDSMIILGHSFGGMVAIKFSMQYPEKTKAIVLIGAPLALQESYKTILKSSREIYEANKDETNIQYLDYLETMDPSSLMYSSYSFMHAMQNGFYSPDSLTAEAEILYELIGSNETLKHYAQTMGEKPPSEFWKNEQYTTIDLSENLGDLHDSGMLIYGLYGKNDGLYSPVQIEQLQSIIGKQNVRYINNCSHSVYIDQQEIFLENMLVWFK
jgi:proline iminopeptidase